MLTESVGATVGKNAFAGGRRHRLYKFLERSPANDRQLSFAGLGDAISWRVEPDSMGVLDDTLWAGSMRQHGKRYWPEHALAIRQRANRGLARYMGARSGAVALASVRAWDSTPYPPESDRYPKRSWVGIQPTSILATGQSCTDSVLSPNPRSAGLQRGAHKGRSRIATLLSRSGLERRLRVTFYPRGANPSFQERQPARREDERYGGGVL